MAAGKRVGGLAGAKAAGKKRVAAKRAVAVGGTGGKTAGRVNRRLNKVHQDFFAALEETGNVSRACEVASLPRRTAYDLRARDSEFSRLWELAVERGTDALEDEAVRRALFGVDKPVYYGGKLVGTVREYSDALLMFVLKARRPELFKERSGAKQEVNVTHQGEPVSDTLRWIEEMLSGGAARPAAKPLPH